MARATRATLTIDRHAAPIAGRVPPHVFFLVSATFHYLGLAVAGVWLLTDVRLAGQMLGFVFAFANCALFMLYVILGHRVAQDGGTEGIDRLGAAMLIALLIVMPIGITAAAPAFRHPHL